MEAIKLFLVSAVGIFLPVQTTESIVREVFSKYDFHKEPGLLQFWACITPSDSEDIGCYLTLTEQTYMLTRDHEGLLQDYRRRCLENYYPLVGVETKVGNWLPGRAAQTRIADHRTIHHALNHEDQHPADVGGKGQLVLPVFRDQGDGNKLVGIIEYVTPVPKESYVEDFEQIHNLLKDEGLNSTYMGKTIKVAYNHIIKFTLPLSAKFTDLRREVIKRFPELKKQQELCVEYDDTEGNRLPISSDEGLQVCMAESSSRGEKFISMCVISNT
ncbi:putative PB1 domain-containing protein [Helianthus annuus]|nr:putative PB1 domain-containing protein [Helianthus annuus]KAJ0446120.1 putative PB1 domain-containing protein [Helianthus annuus]KAJ0824667.1 putative PB1 domain-containing protein [Helianthus annuus]